MSPPLVTPHFLITYPRPATVSDYRCVLNKAATELIFERTELSAGGEAPTRLYCLQIDSTTPPQRLNSLNVSTRADWSWFPGERIAFSNGKGIWLQETISAPPEQLADTQDMAYPAWASADLLVTENSRPDPTIPSPRNTQIDTSGTPTVQMLASTAFWAGMPAACPTSTSLVAFAGQWIGSQSKYDQVQNYIWLTTWGPNFSFQRPLDGGANSSGPFKPQFQGRAPWWSPNGNWIAFESTRADPGGTLYAIFIQDVTGTNPAMQVTDIRWNANHAKWYPDGRHLVVSARQRPGNPPFGVAKLDVGAFVT